MEILENVCTKRMDDLCGTENDIRVVPHAKLANISSNEIKVWCVKNAVYQVITWELVQYLKRFIGNRTAIEVCAGNGALGRALDIPRTDSYVQLKLIEHYTRLGQQITVPPPDVRKLDALEAVRKYDPQVVIASFSTHKWVEGDNDGSMYGVDEVALLAHPSVQAYVVVGNKAVHGGKKIWPMLTNSKKADWLVSRCQDPSQNRIFTWDKTVKIKRR